MTQAQMLEQSLAFLVLRRRHERSEVETIDEYIQLNGYSFNRPLGNLIRQLKDEIPVPPHFEGGLTEALNLRNQLAHRHFTDRLPHWLHEEGLRQVIRELTDAKTKLQNMAHAVALISELLYDSTQQDREEVIAYLEGRIIPALLESDQTTSEPGRGVSGT